MNAKAIVTVAVFVSFAFAAPAATLYVDANGTNPIAPYSDWSTAATNIQDAVDAATNDDLVLVTNGLYQYGGHKVNGYALTNRVAVTKPLTLQSINGPNVTTILGYQDPTTTEGDDAVRCVYLTNAAILSGFTLTNGTTRNTGDIFLEESGGGVCCETANAIVTNCIITGNIAYNSGGGIYSGALANCILTNNSAHVGGGAENSILSNCRLDGNTGGSGGGWGGGADACTLSNCVLTNNYGGGYGGGGASYSSLDHCILANNTGDSGGGAESSTLNRCVLTGNFAYEGAGGANNSTLNNCTLISNSNGGASSSSLNNCLLATNSAGEGAGAYYCTLTNCTLVGNSADIYGAAESSTLNNCILFDNSTTTGPDFSEDSILNFCCSSMTATNGIGNITNDPVFVNPAAGDFHLQSNSPCINSGNNSYVTGTNDFDGNPRIVGGTVDIGAYEYQTPTSVLSYAWAQQYGLPTDGTADYTDADDDGLNDWQEWIAGTNPTNAASVLEMYSPASTNNSSGITITWQSVTNITYYLDRSSDLSAQPPFTTIQSNIVGQTGTTSFTDMSATNVVPYFYRVGVQQ